MIGFNIGSGQRRFETTGDMHWVNVDKVCRPGLEPDIVADGSDLSEWRSDDSVDVVVLHHVLEHFGCGEAENLIKEAYRVLKPSGSLIVFVPDLQALATRWLEGELSTQIYMTNLYGAYMGDEADRHKWGFDEGSLVEFLDKMAPWRFVVRYSGREVPGMNVAQDFWILNVECVK